jgi:hypothetical protein
MPVSTCVEHGTVLLGLASDGVQYRYHVVTRRDGQGSAWTEIALKVDEHQGEGDGGSVVVRFTHPR